MSSPSANPDAHYVSVETLLLLLAEGDFSKIHGAIENEVIDFKATVYDLTGNIRKDQKFELAKDVAAIANANQGQGIICLGIKEFDDKVSPYANEVLGATLSASDRQSYLKIIQDGIVPHLPDDFITFRDFQVDRKNICCICIKELSEDFFPLLVKKRQDEQIGYFLIPVRPGARTASMLSADQIHSYVQYGVSAARLDRKPETLAEIGQKIDRLLFLSEKQSTASSTEHDVSLHNSQESTSLESQIARSMELFGEAQPFFYIWAVPKNPRTIPNFHDRQASGIPLVMMEAPRLRNDGWGIVNDPRYQDPPVFDGSAWNSNSRNDSRTLAVTETGCIFASAMLNGFLDWNLHNEQAQFPANEKLLNNFALVEYIDRFVAFLKELVKRFEWSGEYRVTIGFDLPQNFSVRLYRPPAIAYYRNSFSRPNAVTQFETSISAILKDTKHAAGALIGEFYARCFHETTEPMPYLGRDEEGPFVQEERYKS